MKRVNLQVTLEQLVESLRRLSTEELEELELLLLKNELEKRSEEAKRSSLSLEELESPADV